MTNRFFAGQTDYIEQLNLLDGESGDAQQAIDDHIADTTGAHAASAISNTPAGGIAATTVQAAINELDTEKLSASATALPSSFASASLNSITPTGGTLAVTGGVRSTGGYGLFEADDATVFGKFQSRSGNSALEIGTTSNHPIHFWTNGASRAILDTSGNLGLGATPQSGGGAARWVTAGSDAGSTYSGGFISAVGSTAKGYVYYDSVNTFLMQAVVGVSLGFRANAANDNQMTLDTSGNLLINQTTNPSSYKLAVTGNVGVTGSISATSLVDISAAGAGQIKFPATQNASADANTLDDYQEATYTGTATGMTTSPTGTVSYTLTGNEATLNLPEITGTSNATTFTVTGMPAEARPASRKTVLGRAQDNGGAIVPVRIDIETTGVLTIYANADAGAFTASGSKTLAECSVTYTRV